ncbi:MAG: zinc-dependent metalloprotease, partial [Gammaproteobacteria bacterium]|nr:zinc-dependent metalloprotease [Gammaproteobacteria bacterium]
MSAIDWDQAVRVASRMTGSYALAGTYHEARFGLQAPQMVMRATALVEAETGLHAPGVADVAVVSRKEWVEANIGSFAELVRPAEERLAAQSKIGARIASKVTAAELGAVLGLLSRRVLGQYELVLPRADGSAGDTVMFVGANILAMERQHEFRPQEFRFWVALHEATHRLQFLGIPWMKDYFLGLVNELVLLP